MLTNVLTRTVVGIVAGVLFYFVMSYSIPKEDNCSFNAVVATDVLASIAGIYLMHQGYVLGHGIIYVIGLAIVVEHAMQTLQHKL